MKKNIYKIPLRYSLKLSNFLYKLISFLAIKYEGGIHPKHRLLGYHDFFINNIRNGDTVLDIGCGNGALSFDIAKKAKEVTGIDIEEKNIREAKKKHSLTNLTYIVGDATKDLGEKKFDVITLSNVLEHIEYRVDFLKSIKGLASTYLIRVPMFDRDWIPLYKKELGIEWRLDLTHYTEFTKQTFEKEVTEAGYAINSLSVQFGEIWAVITVQ
jgi:SAM-dependent methyltransferase